MVAYTGLTVFKMVQLVLKTKELTVKTEFPPLISLSCVKGWPIALFCKISHQFEMKQESAHYIIHLVISMLR